MKVELIDHMGSDLSIVNAARVSFAKVHEEFDEKSDTRLINYLAKHNHWSPFGHASMQFHIKAPVFVARQLVKHQIGLTWNEVSRRYVDTEVEFMSLQNGDLQQRIRNKVHQRKQLSIIWHQLIDLPNSAMRIC